MPITYLNVRRYPDSQHMRGTRAGGRSIYQRGNPYALIPGAAAELCEMYTLACFSVFQAYVDLCLLVALKGNRTAQCRRQRPMMSYCCYAFLRRLYFPYIAVDMLCRLQLLCRRFCLLCCSISFNLPPLFLRSSLFLYISKKEK